MDDLPFEKESLDLIWSEGAIYNIGFTQGLREWKKFLKKGGYLAVTEASWFTDERPQEIQQFWRMAYSRNRHHSPEGDADAGGRLSSCGQLYPARKLLDRPFLCSAGGSTEEVSGEIPEKSNRRNVYCQRTA